MFQHARNENEISHTRRNFLSKLTIGAGALGATALGIKSFSFSSEEENVKAANESLLVLTPQGMLALADSAHLQHNHVLPVTNAEARKGIPGKKFVMVFDLAKCDGCGKCTEACQAMHFVPPDREWIKVYKMKDSKNTAPYWFPKSCFQCDDPPCTKVCPVDATFKREDGIVLVDNERCIGCRFCMAACPYSTRFFNWGNPEQPEEIKNIPYSPEQGFPAKIGTVEKCDFCPHLIREGKMPACVTGCPMDAIYFGDENEDAVTSFSGETFRLSELLKDRAGYRYMEELGTKPRVYYLPPKSRIYPGPNESDFGKKERHKHNHSL